MPPPAPGAPLSQQLQVYVEAIRLTGNTVFSDAQISEITKAYEHREVTSGELESLRQALTQYYVDRGFINSGAVIPDQEVKDGVVTIQIVEGVLDDLRITGLDRLRPGYVEQRIALGVDRPLNVNSLSESLQRLKQNPRIGAIRAQLAPGIAPGHAVLDAQVEEARPYYFWLGADNARPPSVGGEQATLRGLHQNLTGSGDTLELEADFAEGLDAFDVRYTVPLTPRDTDLSVWYLTNRSRVVESPFDTLDITFRERSAGLAIHHPLYRTLNRRLTLGARLEKRESSTTLLGVPFSFSPGAEDGETRLTVARLTQEWLDQQIESVLAARSMFSFGLDALDATVSGADEDGRFVAWLGQLQWARRLGERNQVILRSALQLADEPLPSLERFATGGLYTVRGYRENQQVTDEGFNASLEFRVPIWISRDGRQRFQFAPFYDYGAVWNHNRPTPEPRHLSGAGAGVLWNIGRTVDAALYFAHAFAEFKNASDDIQDDGIHFSVSARLL